MEKLLTIVLICCVIASVLGAIPVRDAGTKPPANGTCSSAEDGDTVTVEYEGTFENGTVFDSSVKSLTFDLGDTHVIKAWNTGLKGACVNDEVEIKISSISAQTEAVTIPPSIPLNSDVTFTIHVMNIVKKPNTSHTGNRTATDQTPFIMNATDSESNEDDEDDDPEAVTVTSDTTSGSIWYKLQFLAIPVAVILLILVAYCIYTVEYPDRKIKFYRVGDHDNDGGLNRVI